MTHRLVDPEAITERCGEGQLEKVRFYGEGVDYREYHQHASGGELIRTESYGEHLVADGGRTILSAIDGVPPELWQRFVLGQVLPITASVQGLEIFHASAVSIEDGAIALAGPSGAGKSTLAAALITAGARFFVDDVLAVDITASQTRAYPGPGLISLRPPQVRQLGLDQAIWLDGVPKVIAETSGDRRARPIRAFIALTRDETVDTPQFAPCPPNRLMASTFDALARGPERLQRLLRVCASLASEARALEVRFSSHSDPAALAEAILDRLSVAGEPV